MCALRIYRATRAGRYDEARQQQDKLNDVITACLKFPLIPALKQILEWSGLPCGPSLGPRELTSGETAALRAAIDALGELA
jgi:dihydrodipicolinate synthase/N-acetylneuraminate lyase